MGVEIAQKLKPFSHKPGSSAVLPGTPLIVKAFPAGLEFYHVDEELPHASLSFNISGPVKQFTFQQDLEKGVLLIWGHAAEGYYRIKVYMPQDDAFACRIVAIKSPVRAFFSADAGCTLTTEGDCVIKNEAYKKADFKQPMERLSLGCHKKLDWHRIAFDCALPCVLPIWFLLGQQVPVSHAPEGHSLLKRCFEAIDNGDRLAVGDHICNLLHAGFTGMLCPRKIDSQRQGFSCPPIVGDSALPLLSEGYRMIRELFFKQLDHTVFILPVLPVSLHAGRLLHVRIEQIGLLDMRWSKKVLKTLVIHCHSSGSLNLVCAHRPTSCRIRLSKSDKGLRHTLDKPLILSSGNTYLIDQFK